MMKKMMKKIWVLILTAVLTAGVLSGCGTGTASSAANEKQTQALGDEAENTGDSSADAVTAPGKEGEAAAASKTGEPAEAETAPDAGDGTPVRVVATIFPEYDWVMNILGDRADRAEVTMLLDNGVDLHSYQPTAADILTVGQSDLFIYVGGESDEWVEDALETAANPDLIALNLLQVLGDAVREEEVVEGMQAEEHEHDHEADGQSEEHGEGEVEYDEHVWLSLRNASLLCQAICDALSEIDPAGADTYRANLAAYQDQLLSLDTRYEEAVAEAPVRTLLFGDRFPFRYMTEDYGLDYYAAFVGCSAETEASFETISFLAGKVDELSLHSVMTIEGQDHRIAETIVDTTQTKDQQILTMDSMQSTTSADVQKGASYLSVMESNLETLRKALQ